MQYPVEAGEAGLQVSRLGLRLQPSSLPLLRRLRCLSRVSVTHLFEASRLLTMVREDSSASSSPDKHQQHSSRNSSKSAQSSDDSHSMSEASVFFDLTDRESLSSIAFSCRTLTAKESINRCSLLTLTPSPLLTSSHTDLHRLTPTHTDSHQLTPTHTD